MKNYKNYFEGDNSCNLIDKFNPQKRMGTFTETEDFWTELRSRDFIQGQPSTKHHIEGKDKSVKSKITLRTSFKTLKTLDSRKQKAMEEKSYSKR